ncbi:MAG: hypothetical protein KAY46_27095 [Burkholderiaceae bacterium]|nr:hypothetical protein [Burkholderiaceae bacterium]
MFALDPLLSRVLAICVALVFASAAWHKLRDRDLFAMQLHAYRILPGRALVLGHALAPLEAAAAILLLLDGAHAWGGVLAAALLLLYAGAMALNLLRGRVLDCGCGGAPQPLSWGLVVRNLAMAAMALAAALPREPRALTGDDIWLMAVAVLAWLVLLAAINQVLRQGRTMRGTAH